MVADIHLIDAARSISLEELVIGLRFALIEKKTVDAENVGINRP